MMKLLFNSEGELVNSIYSAIDSLPGYEEAPDGFDPSVGAYKIDGVVHLYTKEQAALKHNIPSIPAIWSNTLMDWVDIRSLQYVKDAKWNDIKRKRTELEGGTFSTGGKTYQINESKISGATVDAMLAKSGNENSWEQPWVLADNSVTTLNANQMISVGRAMKTHISGIWATSQFLRAQIDAATTIPAVEAISWPS